MNRHPRRSRQLLLLSVAGVLAGLLASAGPALAAFPSANGKIAFGSDRDGNAEIYAMNADGTGQTRLTNNPAFDGGPAWSPDGTKLAFSSGRDGSLEIYAMNADGTGQTRMTNNTAEDLEPAWSPDGSKVAFNSLRDGNPEIYAMNADGTGQTRLTNNSAVNVQPAWSPDGSKIAFTSNRDGNSEIYAMNADGSNQTRLTNNAARDFEPDWQPIRTPPPANSCGEVRGDGRLDTNPLTRFVFSGVRSDGTSAPAGEISFSDRGTEPRLHFESTAITTLVITGSHVRLTGAGIANGLPVDFVVEGDDGSPDRFSIRLSNGYAAAGAVAAGRGVNLKPC